MPETNLKDVFERIYVINLPDRVDRKAEMSEQLRIVGLSFEDPFVQLFPARRPETPGDFPSIGARGCYMSHLGAIEQAVSEGRESILILEDDVDWTRAMLSNGPDVISTIKKTDWGFLHGGFGDDPPGGDARFRLERLRPGQELLLAHFVGLRGNAITTAHRYLSDILSRPPGSPEGGPMHVDGAYSWLRKDRAEIASYICVPSVARQRPSLSDISPPTGIKAMPGVRHALASIRKLRKSLR